MKNAIDGCLEAAAAELASHVNGWGTQVHSEVLRKYAGIFDGIRFCNGLLLDRKLLGTTRIGDAREALRAIRIAQMAGAFGEPGFYEGICRVQTAIAKILEQRAAPAKA